MRTTKVSRFVAGRKKGFSIIEVITAVAILGIGIWAIVALFPTGQNIIRRSGLRQLAVQLAHEAVSDYLANPEKMPFAVVPYNPFDPQIANRPVLLEPADLLTVRRTFNFVWGEPIELVPIDPNSDGSPDLWRAIPRFAPIMDANGDGQVDGRDVRVYREVRYRFSAVDRNGNGDPRDDLQDFEFYFDPTQPNALYLAAGITRATSWRVLRVTYLPQGSLIPVVRELYLNNGNSPETFRLRCDSVLEVVEEFPILPDDGSDQDGDGNSFDIHEFRFVQPGVLEFNTSSPRPLGFSAEDARLKGLFASYIVDDPQNGGGHWLVETDATVPAVNGSVFQTTFGGIPIDTSVAPPVPIVQSLLLMPSPQWGVPVSPNPVVAGGSDPQGGLLLFNLTPGTRIRVAYHPGDIPNTPIDESWFLQIVKPPSDFQLLADPNAQIDQRVLNGFPYEQMRWFTVNGNILGFSVLLAGMNIQVKYRDAFGTLFSEVKPIGSNGEVRLSQAPAKIESVSGASILIRVSGQSMWRQTPPKTKADYVELITIIPSASPMQP